MFSCDTASAGSSAPCTGLRLNAEEVVKGMGWMALGAGLGAGMMYLFDPNRGRARRAMLRDRGGHLLRVEEQRATKAFASLANRVRGAEAEFMHRFERDEVDDAKLMGRVRARLGRSIRTPHDVQVLVHDGEVVLRGKVQTDEMALIEMAVKSVRGVKGVINQLADAPMPPPSADIAVAAGV